MGFDPGGGQGGGGQGGWPPGGGGGGQGGWPPQPGQPQQQWGGQPAAPAQPQQQWQQPAPPQQQWPQQGQPAAPPQQQWPQQGQPAAPPQQQWGQPDPAQQQQQWQQQQPGQAPQQQWGGQQPAAPQQQQWGGQAPGAPAQQQWGGQAPGGYDPAQQQQQQGGYGQQQQGGYPQPGQQQYGIQPGAAAAPGVVGAPQTNAWFPAAVVSLVFGGLGLLMIKDGRNRKKLAFAIFGATWVAYILLGVILTSVFAPSIDIGPNGIPTGTVSGGGILLTLVVAINWFIQLVTHWGSFFYTHDEVCRAYPHLGSPLIFKKPLPLPGQLQ